MSSDVVPIFELQGSDQDSFRDFLAPPEEFVSLPWVVKVVLGTDNASSRGTGEGLSKAEREREHRLKRINQRKRPHQAHTMEKSRSVEEQEKKKEADEDELKKLAVGRQIDEKRALLVASMAIVSDAAKTVVSEHDRRLGSGLRTLYQKLDDLQQAKATMQNMRGHVQHLQSTLKQDNASIDAMSADIERSEQIVAMLEQVDTVRATEEEIQDLLDHGELEEAAARLNESLLFFDSELGKNMAPIVEHLVQSRDRMEQIKSLLVDKVKEKLELLVAADLYAEEICMCTEVERCQEIVRLINNLRIVGKTTEQEETSKVRDYALSIFPKLLRTIVRSVCRSKLTKMMIALDNLAGVSADVPADVPAGVPAESGATTTAAAAARLRQASRRRSSSSSTKSQLPITEDLPRYSPEWGEVLHHVYRAFSILFLRYHFIARATDVHVDIQTLLKERITPLIDVLNKDNKHCISSKEIFAWMKINLNDHLAKDPSESIFSKSFVEIREGSAVEMLSVVRSEIESVAILMLEKSDEKMRGYNEWLVDERDEDELVSGGDGERTNETKKKFPGLRALSGLVVRLRASSRGSRASRPSRFLSRSSSSLSEASDDSTSLDGSHRIKFTFEDAIDGWSEEDAAMTLPSERRGSANGAATKAATKAAENTAENTAEKAAEEEFQRMGHDYSRLLHELVWIDYNRELGAFAKEMKAVCTIWLGSISDSSNTCGTSAESKSERSLIVESRVTKEACTKKSCRLVGSCICKQETIAMENIVKEKGDAALEMLKGKVEEHIQLHHTTPDFFSQPMTAVAAEDMLFWRQKLATIKDLEQSGESRNDGDSDSKLSDINKSRIRYGYEYAGKTHKLPQLKSSNHGGYVAKSAVEIWSTYASLQRRLKGVSTKYFKQLLEVIIRRVREYLDDDLRVALHSKNAWCLARRDGKDGLGGAWNRENPTESEALLWCMPVSGKNAIRFPPLDPTNDGYQRSFRMLEVRGDLDRLGLSISTLRWLLRKVQHLSSVAGQGMSVAGDMIIPLTEMCDDFTELLAIELRLSCHVRVRMMHGRRYDWTTATESQRRRQKVPAAEAFVSSLLSYWFDIHDHVFSLLDEQSRDVVLSGIAVLLTKLLERAVECNTSICPIGYKQILLNLFSLQRCWAIVTMESHQQGMSQQRSSQLMSQDEQHTQIFNIPHQFIREIGMEFPGIIDTKNILNVMRENLVGKSSSSRGGGGGGGGGEQ